MADEFDLEANARADRGYFNDPRGTAVKKGLEGKPDAVSSTEKKVDMAALKTQLLRAIAEANNLDRLKKQIEITQTDEGLRIELIEDEKGTFFEVGSAQPLPALQEILKVLAGQLRIVPNTISIEGHTDAQPYSNKTFYGNWELSTDRANVARREMQVDGIRPNQVSQVRGFADQRLHILSKPFDPANRRISLVVQRREPSTKANGTPEHPLGNAGSVSPPGVTPNTTPVSATQVSAKSATLGIKQFKNFFGR